MNNPLKKGEDANSLKKSFHPHGLLGKKYSSKGKPNKAGSSFLKTLWGLAIHLHAVHPDTVL